MLNGSFGLVEMDELRSERKARQISSIAFQSLWLLGGLFIFIILQLLQVPMPFRVSGVAFQISGLLPGLYLNWIGTSDVLLCPDLYRKWTMQQTLWMCSHKIVNATIAYSLCKDVYSAKMFLAIGAPQKRKASLMACHWPMITISFTPSPTSSRSILPELPRVRLDRTYGWLREVLPRISKRYVGIVITQSC